MLTLIIYNNKHNLYSFSEKCWCSSIIQHVTNPNKYCENTFKPAELTQQTSTIKMIKRSPAVAEKELIIQHCLE